jgi:hypothetical protein
MLALRIEGLFRNLGVSAFKLVDRGREKNVALLAAASTAPDPEMLPESLAGSSRRVILDLSIEASKTRTTLRLKKCVNHHPVSA